MHVIRTQELCEKTNLKQNILLNHRLKTLYIPGIGYGHVYNCYETLRVCTASCVSIAY